MKGFKKILSTTLAALLVAGSASLTFAKGYEDVKEDNLSEIEISILSDLGVILGTSENEFSPDKNVTREQMATLLFRLMLGRDDAGEINTTAFTDLYEPYYNGAISWANAAGFIKGVADDRFNPTGGITKQDAMTMLVRALGHGTDNMNAGYPWSYINVATRIGLDKGLEKVPYTQALTRAETAKMLYNALVSDYVVTKTQNGSVVELTSSIIEEVFGYSIVDATVIATNDYSMNGNTVVKNGYVTLLAVIGGKEVTMTVPADDLNMKGSANSNIGKTFKVICGNENGKYSVLSSVQTTNVERYEVFTVNKNGTVSIGGVKYTLVKEFSDELSTNANELMLYYMTNDGEMIVIPDGETLDKLEGFVSVELMSNGGKITHGIVKSYKMGTLEISQSGAINLAGGKNQADISMVMPEGTKNGDTVLYRYNEKAEELEISAVMKAETGLVVRLTKDGVMIGDNLYAIGNEKSGIKAEEIRKQLSLGEEVTVLVHGGTVVKVLDGVRAVEDGKYMISVSDARLVYENGMFRYVMTVYVDGEMKNVIVKDGNGKNGYVYRYTENDGVYSITEVKRNGNVIVSGSNGFIQSDDEVGFAVIGANGTSITLSSGGLYTLSAGQADYASSNGENKVQFVTDENTVIIVRDKGVMKQISGKYASTINVNENAVIVAVMNNEVGAVETLRFMYISDGSLGNYDMNAQTVRIISNNGLVFVDGKVYTEYTVYSFADGEVKTMLSRESALTAGADYRLGADGTITSDKAEEMNSGVVTGYTSGTVSVDKDTYAVNKDVRVIVLTKDGKVVESTIAEMYGKNVEFTVVNGEVVFMMLDMNAVAVD